MRTLIAFVLIVLALLAATLVRDERSGQPPAQP